ncbi:MAG: leucine--tRNA ligase [Candidatus Aenigmarchaeota archaeon]|nr:leucine--tRNA ligase [Candidatus Aenigmarchaeota archaeon]
MDFKENEKKWQARWDEARIFETDPDKRKKFFTSLIIPYVNGNAHIGHSFTFTRSDVYARFKRMNGYNSLLTQGFHATGEPILGVVERLRQSDQSQIATLKLYGATDEDIENFKKDPKYVANYWMKKIVGSMKEMGYSIDWRRRFVTAIDPCFNSFIEWQYNKLKEKGYVVQGTHPVVWCSHDQSPTGDHDRLKGEGEGTIEYTIIKFSFEDEDGHKFIFPCATLRPETIYGVTNIWLKPETEYILAIVNNETWVISKDALDKLNDQLFEVSELGFVQSEEFFGKRAKNPSTEEEVPILPGNFVEMGTGTGVVMSVPGHAPFDWVGIKTLLKNKELSEKYKIDSNIVKPISVISLEGYGEFPAVEMVESMKADSKEKLEKITAELYKKEFHQGVLNNNCKTYAGQKVSEVKDHLIERFRNIGRATSIWETTGLVVCRCNNKCHVKILENQWFLNYSNDRWKNDVKRHLEIMRLYPEDIRGQFLNTIDWLKDKACARKSGLGTKLPWDKDWIVETLSDSTIYMAYYTISKTINDNNIIADKLNDEVFDFIFLSKGDLKQISKNCGLDESLLKEMKENFEYFYPMDFRNSGKDLVQHHLIFFIYHHVAIFPEKYWPRSIAVNGYVNVAGEKMSKSKGNIIPLSELIEKHGADLVRLNISTSAEGMDDADWRDENTNPLKSRLMYLNDLVDKIERMESNKTNVDNWLELQMHKIIKETTTAYEETKFRSAINASLFNAVNDMKWYMRRSITPNKTLVKEFLENIIKLIAPITPHYSEEVWNKLGHKTFVSIDKWPQYKDAIILKGDHLDKDELFVKKTLEDIEHVKKLAKRQKPSKIILFVAKSDKFADKKDKHHQIRLFEEAHLFLKKEYGCDIEVLDSDIITSHNEPLYQNKATTSKPEKLGVIVF